MKLRSVEIENFRAVKYLKLSLDRVSYRVPRR